MDQSVNKMTLDCLQAGGKKKNIKTWRGGESISRKDSEQTPEVKDPGLESGRICASNELVSARKESTVRQADWPGKDNRRR